MPFKIIINEFDIYFNFPNTCNYDFKLQVGEMECIDAQVKFLKCNFKVTSCFSFRTVKWLFFRYMYYYYNTNVNIMMNNKLFELTYL